MAAALPTPPATPRRDPEFYCQDIVFQVEDVLFKVSRRPFEEDSDGFSSMFTLPSSNQASVVEGTSDANPVHLHGVTADDFRSLLYVLFPASYGGTRPLTKEQWMSALRLADMWDFEGVRDKAIDELRKLIPWHAERVSVARRFGIPGWIEPALKELAQQDSISATELQMLGWSTAAKLFQVRECVQFGGSCTCGCSYCSAAHGHLNGALGPPPGTRPGVVTAASVRRSTDFTLRIREIFGGELF